MSLFTKTVDSILADFTKKVEDLRTISEAKIAEAKDYDTKADEYALKAEEATAESTRAFIVAGKIAALLG